MSIELIITAAGQSQRFGSPKQFHIIDGVPMIQKTIEAFSQNTLITSCIITMNKSSIQKVIDIIQNISSHFPIRVISGSDTRMRSVKKAVEHSKEEYILIHDGARPFVTEALINNILSKRHTNSAIIPGIPCVDTMKQLNGNYVKKTLNRDSIIRVQTPQLFKRDELIRAYAAYEGKEVTDESQLLEALNIPIYVVSGDESNIKITFPQDCI